ncbi:MAG: HD-GYP domain-containing protein [Desulfatibacillaceae bacterium]
MEDERDLRERVGARLVRNLYRLAQTVRMYQDNNQVLAGLAEEFGGLVGKWCRRQGDFTLKLARGRFFLDGEKIPVSRQDIRVHRDLLHYFRKRNLDGFHFDVPDKPLSVGVVCDFARLLNQAENESDPVEWIRDRLEESRFGWVEVVRAPRSEEDEDDDEIVDEEARRRERARKTYSFALASIREISEKLVHSKRVGVSRLKRMAQQMVDLLMEDESLFMGMSTIRDYDDYTFSHSVNVAILALGLGKYVGLGKPDLESLAICGLLHDLGKVNIPQEIINKPGRLNEEEFRQIRRHPLFSVGQIAKLNVSRDLKSRIMLAPFEHHLKYDLTGYPKTSRKQPISLFGRIITIADFFDAVTSPRKYRSTTFSPDQALMMLLRESGTCFDPLLVKAFVNMLGVYPVGTLLLLDSGEMALVVDRDTTGDRNPLRVLILETEKVGVISERGIVTLVKAEPGQEPQRRIVGSANPHSHGVQPSAYILGTH